MSSPEEWRPLDDAELDHLYGAWTLNPIPPADGTHLQQAESHRSVDVNNDVDDQASDLLAGVGRPHPNAYGTPPPHGAPYYTVGESKNENHANNTPSRPGEQAVAPTLASEQLDHIKELGPYVGQEVTSFGPSVPELRGEVATEKWPSYDFEQNRGVRNPSALDGVPGRENGGHGAAQPFDTRWERRSVTSTSLTQESYTDEGSTDFGDQSAVGAQSIAETSVSAPEEHFKKVDGVYVCLYPGCKSSEKARKKPRKKPWTTPSQFNHHYRYHDRNQKRIKCPTCGEEFRFPKELERHSSKHIDRTAYKYPCRKCKKPYSRADNRDRHEKEHCPRRRHESSSNASDYAAQATPLIPRPILPARNSDRVPQASHNYPSTPSHSYNSSSDWRDRSHSGSNQLPSSATSLSHSMGSLPPLQYRQGPVPSESMRQLAIEPTMPDTTFPSPQNQDSTAGFWDAPSAATPSRNPNLYRQHHGRQ